MPAKPTFSIFVAYASADVPLADTLREEVRTRCPIQRDVDLDLWSDVRIAAGEPWEERIAAALAGADGGLVLLSPAVLASDFVARVELPALARTGRVVPAALVPVDPKRYDLRELAHRQVFLHRPPRSRRRLSFKECRGAERDHFCDGLMAALVDRLADGGDAAA
jgi:hypothetical protein